MPDGAIQYQYTSPGKGAKTSAGPTAGTAIASLTPPVGVHDVEVWVGISGTSAVATDSNNVQVKFGSALLIDLLPYASTTAGTTNSAGPWKMRVMCDGSTAITANVIANATATAIYAASIVATRVGP